MDLCFVLVRVCVRQTVRSGVMDSSEVGVRGTWGRQREGSERWCQRAAIQTAMPPAAAMATWFSVLRATLHKASQACSRTAALSGCAFMTASMACRGKGGVGVSIWCVGGVRVGVVGVIGKVGVTVRC